MASTHGPQCGGEGWDTVCAVCRRDVFYFHCDHGSKVFFDRPGGDWPRHACKARTTSSRKASLPTGGVFDGGAFPGIPVYHGGYTRAVAPPVQAPRQLKCNYCGIPQADPKKCMCNGKPLKKVERRGLRTRRKALRGGVSAASEDPRHTAIGTISRPRISTAAGEPTKRGSVRKRRRSPR